MIAPPPPLNAHGQLAVNTADIADHLEYGLTSGCVVCDHSAIHHWRMPSGEYMPVHATCVTKLIEEWRARIEAGQVDEPDLASGARRGAYARRSTATGARVHPPRPASRRSRRLGSPYFRPGMPEGSPWVVVVETHNGRHPYVHGDSEVHARHVFERYRALTERGWPIGLGDPLATGAALLDPTGAVVARWGDEFALDSPPRWEGVSRTPHWTDCLGCKKTMWPWRLISKDGRCQDCVAAREADDPRVWLAEPPAPAWESWPPEFGGPKRKKKSSGPKGKTFD